MQTRSKFLRKNKPYDLQVTELDFNSQSRMLHTGSDQADTAAFRNCFCPVTSFCKGSF